APEQLQGRALPQTDIYAIGATAVAGLTGLEPELLPHRGLRLDVGAALRGRASPAMIASLEQMLEPDPDRGPAPVAAALASLPPRAQPFAARAIDTDDEAAAKSIRKLLWALWGIGWVIVPLLLDGIGVGKFIPLVMFSWLALNIIVGWHKGALIRMALRA